MGEFVKAIGVSDLAPGACMEVSVAEKPVALFNLGGTFCAISNTCLHRGGPLGQGTLEGQVVTCPWHGWTYDVTTGVSTVNAALKVASYEVKVENDQVLVKIE